MLACQYSLWLSLKFQDGAIHMLHKSEKWEGASWKLAGVPPPSPPISGSSLKQPLHSSQSLFD